MLAFVFPGQGSQFVGMGRDLYERHAAAREVIDFVEERTRLPLKHLMWDGPESDLTATQHAQVALFACGVAAWNAFRAGGGPDAACMAGHSLGEYTALVAAGALDLGPAADLVALRGRSMAQAPEGTMAAVLGLDPQKLDEICEATPGVVVVANYNSPDQLVISGEPQAVAKAGEAATRFGAKRVLPLNVSGAFHSPLMLPALGALTDALNRSPWRDATVPVVHNVDARPNRRADQFADRLSRQLASGVRWTDCIGTMRDQGVTTWVELGAGKTLTGLLRRIDRNLAGHVVDDAASLDKALEALDSGAKAGV
ncbi:MAG: ACP S-malonyltransferase [Candidatus Sericytochromatia bacterium]|nr:ACP S-malonyltransferase [Candidatus Tanganyikabacteria bacterium]